jgi:hypothetical protein
LQAFSDAFPTPTQAQLTTVQTALNVVNQSDQTFIGLVNAGLAAGQSDFSDAIAQLDSAIQAFQSALNALSGPAIDMAKANQMRAQKITPYVKK